MKVILGLFVIMHGLIHSAYLVPSPDDPAYPFVLSKGWFADTAGFAKPVGIGLAVIAVLSLVIAGLTIAGVPGLAGSWKLFTILGALSSLLLLTLFWHSWLVIGMVIDALLIYSVIGSRSTLLVQ